MNVAMLSMKRGLNGLIRGLPGVKRKVGPLRPILALLQI
jgi:hypothetical protein